MSEVECFFDCSSPWTYFAFHNLLELRKEIGVDIAFRPHLVGGVFNAVNPSVHNSREKPIARQGRLQQEGPDTTGLASSASACTTGRRCSR